jgi:hypothetical protein
MPAHLINVSQDDRIPQQSVSVYLFIFKSITLPITISMYFIPSRNYILKYYIDEAHSIKVKVIPTNLLGNVVNKLNS